MLPCLMQLLPATLSTDTIAQLKDGMVEIVRRIPQGEQNAESLKDIEMHLRELETIKKHRVKIR